MHRVKIPCISALRFSHNQHCQWEPLSDVHAIRSVNGHHFKMPMQSVLSLGTALRYPCNQYYQIGTVLRCLLMKLVLPSGTTLRCPCNQYCLWESRSDAHAFSFVKGHFVKVPMQSVLQMGTALRCSCNQFCQLAPC